MILKVLLVIVVIAIVYFAFIKKKPLKNTSRKDKKSTNVNEMIECPVCHVYTEIDDCILSNAKYYCSKECLEKIK